MPNTKFSLIYLALLLILVVVILSFGHVTESIATLLVGLGVGFSNKIYTIFDFYYGSSQGSKDKDAALNKGNPTP